MVFDKTLINLFGGLERSVKIKIHVNFHSCPGLGRQEVRVNMLMLRFKINCVLQFIY